MREKFKQFIKSIIFILAKIIFFITAVFVTINKKVGEIIKLNENYEKKQYFDDKKNMSYTQEEINRINESGIGAIVMVAHMNNLQADGDQIKHNFAVGQNLFSEIDLISAAREIGMKSKKIEVNSSFLFTLKMPMIVTLKTGEYIILAKKVKEQVLILNTNDGKPSYISKKDFLDIWSGTAFLFAEKRFSIKEEIFGLQWFLPVIFRYKKALIEVLVASLTIQIVGLSTPLIMQVIIDKVLVHKALSTLDVLAFGLIIVAIFEVVLSFIRTYIFTHTTSRIDVILNARLFKHMFKLPLSFFESRKVGNIIARVREVENIRNFLTGAPLMGILDVMFIAVYLFVMFFYTTKLSIIFLMMLPALILLNIMIMPLLKEKLEEKFKFGAEAQSFLVENINGIQTVKSLALEPFSQKKWEDITGDYVKSGFKVSLLGGYASAISKFISSISDLIILWVGARLVIESQISMGQLIAFRMLAGRVSGPVLRISNMWQQFQQAGLSIRRLGDIFNATPEPSMDSSKGRIPDIKGDISLKNITFRYKVDGQIIIKDFTADIPAGKTVGIVGRSGSGKSTISKLLQRMYIAESGKITIDGIDLSMADPAWLRRQIGVVLQENFLFSGTIRENICIHKPNASMAEIIDAAITAGAHEFILEMDDGYNTMVGEKGSSLSGGQRQRVAIARALITNPKILIFDEATSALDYESERVIQQNLSKICRGRTVLIIAHRLSTLRDADLIMAMDRGVLAEYGTQEELLNKNGLYRYLYDQQEMKKQGN